MSTAEAGGPWLDDARRLLALLATGGAEPGGTAGGTAAGDQTGGRTDGAHPPECTWCPLCQLLRLARQASPDLLERVAETATAMAATIRAGQAAGGEPEPGPAAEPPPATERIDIA